MSFIEYLKFNAHIVLNNMSILFGFEKRLKLSNHLWKKYKLDKSRSLQENVGFSHRKDVEEALAKTHNDLVATAKKYLHENDTLLDIGCGAGLYLKDFKGSNYKLAGIDISPEMIEAARAYLVNVKFHVGNFMEITLSEKFNLIYSISVLEYIARTDMDAFFRKLSESLFDNGIIFIHYPHAVRFVDTLYPDLNYIKYSPEVVEKYASKYFEIISHCQAFDERVIKKFDKTPYSTVVGSFKDGYLLVARKLK